MSHSSGGMRNPALVLATAAASALIGWFMVGACLPAQQAQPTPVAGPTPAPRGNDGDPLRTDAISERLVAVRARVRALRSRFEVDLPFPEAVDSAVTPNGFADTLEPLLDVVPGFAATTDCASYPCRLILDPESTPSGGAPDARDARTLLIDEVRAIYGDTIEVDTYLVPPEAGRLHVFFRDAAAETDAGSVREAMMSRLREEHAGRD